MSSKKHTDTATGLNKPYEENEIGLRGIFGFAIGLFLLIVVTFGLMWAFLNVLKDNAKQENAAAKNPMAMTDKERLPPEPRLQLAPGFGVESDKGFVNMELQAPGAEYRELRKQWEEIWKNGRKDEKTGMMTIMPIDMAKEKFLTQNAKAKTGAEAEEFYKNARSYISDSSAGRLASEKRR
jgi:hypothetical protein